MGTYGYRAWDPFMGPRYAGVTVCRISALFQLSMPVQYSDHVSPMCLPRAYTPVPAPKAPGVVTGWGLMAAGILYHRHSRYHRCMSMLAAAPSTVTLRQATATMVSQEDCKMDYPFTFQEQVMLCATVRPRGRDTCKVGVEPTPSHAYIGAASFQGDSGGPLVYYDKGTQKWTQVGVASWGDPDCGSLTKPRVYAKVSKFIEWIEKFTTVSYAV